MRYEFQLSGLTPLLMHADDVEQADAISDWRKNAENQGKMGKAKGDDRSPAWTWMTYLYADGGRVAFPYQNLQKCLSEAGAKVILKGNTTFKQVAVSLVFFEQDFPAFTVGGKPVPLDPYKRLRDELDFAAHLALVRKVGLFDLDAKRATVGSGKHVRVRPRFDRWEIAGSIDVTDPEIITPARLDELFAVAGRLGVGDWRPSSPRRPGRFGMFTHVLRPVK